MLYCVLTQNYDNILIYMHFASDKTIFIADFAQIFFNFVFVAVLGKKTSHYALVLSFNINYIAIYNNFRFKRSQGRVSGLL